MWSVGWRDRSRPTCRACLRRRRGVGSDPALKSGGFSAPTAGRLVASGIRRPRSRRVPAFRCPSCPDAQRGHTRSEEHTSELQSQSNLVCRLLLEKKKKKKKI